MTENDITLVTLFERRLRSILAICNALKERVGELERLLLDSEEALLTAKSQNEALQTRYANLLTVKALNRSDARFLEARKQVDKLVREVDNCINLINI
jgi:hypothetical protein